jgi:hypothetical protein
MWNRFAPRLRRAIYATLEEAGRCGAEVAAPEHLLSALLQDPESAAAFMIESCTAKVDSIVLQNHNGQSDISQPLRVTRFSSMTMVILEAAATEADRLETKQIGTEHILLAMLRGNAGDASQKLADVGMTFDAARTALKRWSSLKMPPRKDGLLRRIAQSSLPSSIAKGLSLPALGWGVFVQKSLGHPAFVHDPYRLYRSLRKRSPIRRDPIVPVWVLMRYDDVNLLLKDARFRKDPYLSDPFPQWLKEQLKIPAVRENFEGDPLAMLFIDPPRHTRIRSQFNRAFTPRALSLLEPFIQEVADRQMDLAESRGQMDIIRDLAVPLPVSVIGKLLGFPAEDYDKLKKWSDDFAAALAIKPTPEQVERSAQSRTEMNIYFDQVADDIRRNPRECLINTLLNAPEENKMSPLELFANSALLVAAGHETTTNLIGNGMLALLRSPDQLKLLIDKPELIESAVEEMLRFDSPIQWTARQAGVDIELGGQLIRRGDVVLGCVGAANRDPAQFDNPERFDITRQNNKHLSFGQGIHYCIGATLARMEAQIAVGTLLRRFPKIRPAMSRVRWHKNIIFRGVNELVVQLK